MDYSLIAPELILALFSLSVLAVDFYSPEKKILPRLSIAGLGISLLSVLALFGSEEVLFGGMWIVDDYAIYFKLLFLLAGILVVLASSDYIAGRKNEGEYYVLLIWAVLGAMWVASSGDLINLFVSFELAGISTYALAGFFKDEKSSEAAMKYFIIGTMSSALFLFGMSIIYGLTGTTNLSAIRQSLDVIGANPLALLGVASLIAGFGFEMAIVPFHMWVPDTYQGAPTTVTAFLASVVEAMAFAAVFRLFFGSLGAMQMSWSMAFVVLALITMTLGNVVALAQANMKRMLAYSSIGHAGYVIIALAVISPLGIAGGLLHILGSILAKGGAFIAAALVVRQTGLELIKDYSGLRKTAPITALCMTIFLLSLAGIPPLIGFVSKFVLVSAAIEAGGIMIWLAIFLIVNSAISLYFYTMVMKQMHLGEPKEGVRIHESGGFVAAMLAAMILTIAIGLYPEPLIRFLLAIGGGLLT